MDTIVVLSVAVTERSGVPEATLGALRGDRPGRAVVPRAEHEGVDRGEEGSDLRDRRPGAGDEAEIGVHEVGAPGHALLCGEVEEISALVGVAPDDRHLVPAPEAGEGDCPPHAIGAARDHNPS
jgi:hypothetical protein